MAKKDIINFSGVKTTGVNTSFIVGAGKDNGPADLMLVQALFHYLVGLARQDIKMRSGLAGIDRPIANGKLDAKTNFAIWKFQQANAQKLLSVDGQIHPANYEGRVMKSDMTDYIYQTRAKPIMTITLLHIYAFFAETEYAGDYISALVVIAPDLKSWLT